MTRSKGLIRQRIHGPGRGLRVTASLRRIAVEAPDYAANDLGGSGAKNTPYRDDGEALDIRPSLAPLM
ncbi:hypothetical protein [Massilia sp. Root418]|uniref:hypothetical protein n=1 Tax=Massilia sp. Root418 TaxID=1736532 RepID=UPI000A85952F|nr:hypothetical protein [Massilia sp. Root418]